MLRDKEQREVDGIMYKEEKIYVLKDKKLRAEIIWLHHNMPVEGHRGQWKTVELITRNFQQLEIMKEVKWYIEECDACVTVVLWTSSHILYGLPLHKKGDISKATC